MSQFHDIFYVHQELYLNSGLEIYLNKDFLIKKEEFPSHYFIPIRDIKPFLLLLKTNLISFPELGIEMEDIHKRKKSKDLEYWEFLSYLFDSLSISNFGIGINSLLRVTSLDIEEVYTTYTLLNKPYITHKVYHLSYLHHSYRFVIRNNGFKVYDHKLCLIDTQYDEDNLYKRVSI